MNVFEKEKIDHSIYEDFIREIEMLNTRIFVLEKHLLDQKQTKRPESKEAPNLDKLVLRVNSHIDHIHKLCESSSSVVHIQNVVQNLQAMITKESRLEQLVEEVQGFTDYFNDQWNKFNLSLLEQNTAISREASLRSHRKGEDR